MEARKLLPQLAVSEISDRAEFVALAPEWDALVRETNDQLFYRHEFIRIWVDNFAPTARLRVLIARDGDGRLCAALPLVQRKSSFYGLPISELSATANAHSCRFDMLAKDPSAAGEAFIDYLAQDLSWDVVRLTDVPDGGAGFALQLAAKRRGFPVGEWTSLDSPYIPLKPTWAEQAATLQSKFKANCRRRRKKLEEKGKLTFERYDGDDALDARLEEGFALEQSGWKGQNGTAMAQDKATRGFYSELARAARHGGYLRFYFLRLDGRAVGFHYGLRWNDTYLLLKPGYDETIKECSPGQLLVENVLEDCISSGLREFDFLGPDMPWKRDWTSQTRRHSWLFVFRDTTFGRALCTAKFKWVPAAKEMVAKWKK